MELGIGIGLGKETVVVGEPEHLFHKLGNIHRVPDWNAAVSLLQRLAD